MCDCCSNQPEGDSGSSLLFGLIIGAIIGAVVAVVLYHQDKDKIMAQFRLWLNKVINLKKSKTSSPRPRRSAPKRFKRLK